MTLKCFVLMPFSAQFNSYYQDILAPAIKDAGYEPLRADEIYGTRPVIEDVFNGIREAAVLVADVSGKNPNVNYELGVAHALRRPVVIISQSAEDIPFDYRHLRVVLYDTKEADWTANLRTKVVNTLERIKSARHLPANISSLSGEINMYMLQRSTYKIFYQMPFKRTPHVTINCDEGEGAAIVRVVEQEAEWFVIYTLISGKLKMRWTAEGELVD